MLLLVKYSLLGYQHFRIVVVRRFLFDAVLDASLHNRVYRLKNVGVSIALAGVYEKTTPGGIREPRSSAPSGYQSNVPVLVLTRDSSKDRTRPIIVSRRRSWNVYRTRLDPSPSKVVIDVKRLGWIVVPFVSLLETNATKERFFVGVF